MTPLELEQCILLAYSDVTGETHWQATRALCGIPGECSDIAVPPANHDTRIRPLFLLNVLFKVTKRNYSRANTAMALGIAHFQSRTPHVRTKAAVVLAYLLQYAFSPSDWKRAFHELQQEAPPDLFFKTLIALAENVDFDSCGIKDVMRGYHNNDTTTHCYSTRRRAYDCSSTHGYTATSCITTYKDETLLTLALLVLKDFASWVDVTLVGTRTSHDARRFVPLVSFRGSGGHAIFARIGHSRNE